jgi:LmbE family N-acetylglucosaminyl deacetylase
MAELNLDAVGRYDSLYLSPGEGDALLSCAARLHADASQGRTALVLNLFAGPSFRESPGPRPSLPGLDQVAIGLPSASERHPGRRVLSSLRFDTFPEDDALRDRVTRLLVDLRPRVAPLHVFAPLGVGGHVDHRIAHEAAVGAFGGREAGRNVFLYEDRPEAVGRGQVRLRLGLLGARLPAGAVRAAERSGFLRYLSQQNRGARLRGERGGLVDRLQALRFGIARWRAAQGWNPQRAYGPRLQPVVQVADAAAAAFAKQVGSAVVPEARGAAARFQGLAASYAQRLSGAEHAERYWLLLPLLEADRESATALEDRLI